MSCSYQPLKSMFALSCRFSLKASAAVCLSVCLSVKIIVGIIPLSSVNCSFIFSPFLCKRAAIVTKFWGDPPFFYLKFWFYHLSTTDCPCYHLIIQSMPWPPIYLYMTFRTTLTINLIILARSSCFKLITTLRTIRIITDAFNV